MSKEDRQHCDRCKAMFEQYKEYDITNVLFFLAPEEAITTERLIDDYIVCERCFRRLAECMRDFLEDD